MPVMGLVKFERLFRAAGGVTVDRDDVNRYLDFVNDAIYDLMVIGQATAKANVRDVIEPWDLPITKGLQESMHQFEKLEEEIELQPILESPGRPATAPTSRWTRRREARLPLIFGGISVALAKTFKFIDAELKAVHTEEWERTFSLFRLLMLNWASRAALIASEQMLVDWNSGHSISETLWDSPKTLAASRSVAARVRVETVKSTGCVIRALEEYDLVFNTARIGGV